MFKLRLETLCKSQKHSQAADENKPKENSLKDTMMVPAARRSKLHQTKESMLFLQADREAADDPDCPLTQGLDAIRIIEEVMAAART